MLLMARTFIIWPKETVKKVWAKSMIRTWGVSIVSINKLNLSGRLNFSLSMIIYKAYLSSNFWKNRNKNLGGLKLFEFKLTRSGQEKRASSHFRAIKVAAFDWWKPFLTILIRKSLRTIWKFILKSIWFFPVLWKRKNLSKKIKKKFLGWFRAIVYKHGPMRWKKFF